MATYNANTVREEARLEELAHCAEERGVEILAVQEHRRVHTDQPINYRRVGGYTFITSSHGVMMPRQQQVAWDSW